MRILGKLFPLPFLKKQCTAVLSLLCPPNPLKNAVWGSFICLMGPKGVLDLDASRYLFPLSLRLTSNTYFIPKVHDYMLCWEHRLG